MAKKRKTTAQKKILKEEQKIEKLQHQELQTLQSLKEEVAKDVGSHPLTKITRADVVRSIIGALIGIVGHFAFFYGVEIADRISVLRATSLYLLSLVVCFFFMYYSGFRKVKEIRIFRFIPVRVAVVYLISIIVVVGTLFIFGFIDFSSSFTQVYKVTATTLLLAVLGASTADILGRGE
ncbi:DUF2391 family protein [Candidatus Woesearchaeota archaeon]|nr:DUF2391 family protein [Candidatus Woesearchaeota archaeon]